MSRLRTGTTNDAGDSAAGSDATCTPILCEDNQRVLNNTCVACIPGTRNDAGDRANGDDTNCDVIVCDADQRVENNFCVPCAERYTRPAGDLATGPNTQCERLCTPGRLLGMQVYTGNGTFDPNSGGQ